MRQKKLTGYRADPNKSNSLLMISQAELTTFLIGSVSPAVTPDKVGRPPLASVAKLTSERDTLLEHLQKANREIDILNKMIEQQSLLIEEFRESREMLTEQGKFLQLDLQRREERAERLQQKVDQMAFYFALPFWRRWRAKTPLLK